MQVLFVEVSQNAKTGPIPASIVERVSCWPGCALYENGCYAEAGALAVHWNRVSRGLAGACWSKFCAKVAALRPGRLWRYAQAGDLPGYGPEIDGTLLEELVAANTGKNVSLYAAVHSTWASRQPPQARGKAGLVARIFGEAQPLLLAVGNVAETVDGDVGVLRVIPVMEDLEVVPRLEQFGRRRANDRA
jgi:hypothetical protein